MMESDRRSSRLTTNLMILDSDVAVSQISEPRLELPAKSSPAWSSLLAALLLFFVVVVSLQWASGVYRTEFGAYPDEPAHYVTSLMIWDYIRHLHFFESPLAFARNYYEHYPKVALGHWPPFFYLLQALWMLIFSPSRISVRLEIAATTAVLALSLFREVRVRFGWRAGILAGLLCVSLPLVQTYSDEEMAEILLTLLCFWSTCFLARFAVREQRRDALYFAIFFALAVLTKGSGWLLAMLPPVVFFMTRKPRLLISRTLLASCGLVLVVCVPWQLFTMRLAERGWEGGTSPSASYTLSALPEFLGLFPSILGPAFVAMMLVGIVTWCILPAFRGSLSPLATALFALLIAVWIFHSLVPAGVEDRKLIIAVPSMVFFVVAGIKWLAHAIPVPPAFRAWRSPVLTAILAICFFVQTFYIPRVEHYGYDGLARYIVAHPEWRNSKVLVSSNSVGEGLVVSEIAMLQPEPSFEIVRATKALASVEWNGAGYRCRFSSVPDLLRFVSQEQIRLVVVDRIPPIVHFTHDDLVKGLLSKSPQFSRLATFPAAPSPHQAQIELYRSDF